MFKLNKKYNKLKSYKLFIKIRQKYWTNINHLKNIPNNEQNIILQKVTDACFIKNSSI